MSALSKGIAIIDTVTVAGNGLSFSVIVERTGLSKASVHRLRKELVELSALS